MQNVNDAMRGGRGCVIQWLFPQENPAMQLLTVSAARIERFVSPAGKTLKSAIRKRPVDGRVAVQPLGLDGDEQANPKYHGGPSKAVYAYPSEHYPFWRTVLGQAGVALDLQHGGLGENLTLAGLLENQVWQGDRLRFADCELTVTEPRQPCGTFNANMGFNQAAKLMAQSGWCGFYLAVSREGHLAAGEAFELIPGPREVSIAEWFRTLMKKKA
jgi:MOSC domain-containing protein YiiM